MAKGGRRDGAGRKPGSVNLMSAKAREEAAKTGELPHEFMLRVMRGEEIDGHTPEFKDRMDAAKAAAPYFAPRLASTNIDATLSGQRRSMHDYSEEELWEILLSALPPEEQERQRKKAGGRPDE